MTIRPSIFAAALLTASAASGLLAARVGARAMRWAIYGSLEAMASVRSVRRG